MGNFTELVKNFDKTRYYIRDFFIYGFKVRGDFGRKSTRTYDDEKRRIESWIGDYIKYEHSGRGKKISISLDSGTISENPLYNAYYSKSFTANDIKLHFLIMDVLRDGEFMTLKEIVEKTDTLYNELFDIQTVRNKLMEYVREGVIITEKQGKTAYFRISPDSAEKFTESFRGLEDAIKFFSETQKFGVIGNSILRATNKKNDIFVTKHNYIVHTLEDIIIPDILEAIQNKRYITVVNHRNRNKTIENIVPLQIISSLETGRRYLAMYIDRHYTSMRLDFTEKVVTGEVCDFYDKIYNKFVEYRKYSFSASFGTGRIETEPETVVINFIIDEKDERYIIERLEREKRNGVLERTGKNRYRLTIKTFDTGELLPWIRTFTGRIESIESNNQAIMKRFCKEIDIMKNNIYKEG
ncbi:MAG: WYL domain-containing protein [Ruminococcus sp.]|nr:WYL domain-containing protein [Ruminococcus sp.]